MSEPKFSRLVHELEEAVIDVAVARIREDKVDWEKSYLHQARRDLLDAIEDAITNAREEADAEGRKEGYERGYKEGHADGYESGLHDTPDDD